MFRPATGLLRRAALSLACGTAVASTLAAPAAPARSDAGVSSEEWDKLFILSKERPIAGKTALVTGCSSGIGKATACMLATAGCDLVLVARRQDKLEELKSEIFKRAPGVSVTVVAGDVTSDKFYETLKANNIPQRVDILVANAGGAAGKDTIGTADVADWESMMTANTMGSFRLINLCLPHMINKGGGHVVATGSIAGLEAYEGGSVYCASKFALHAFMRALRLETYTKNVRVTLLVPGLVGEGTEFSDVRFKGDKLKVAATYKGVKELSSGDCASQILWALRQPSHVNVDMLWVQPTAQGSATRIHRT